MDIGTATSQARGQSRLTFCWGLIPWGYFRTFVLSYMVLSYMPFVHSYIRTFVVSYSTSPPDTRVRTCVLAYFPLASSDSLTQFSHFRTFVHRYIAFPISNIRVRTFVFPYFRARIGPRIDTNFNGGARAPRAKHEFRGRDMSLSFRGGIRTSKAGHEF